MAIQYTFKVRWGDTDPARIVFFPNFYRWMDEATHEFFSEIGYPTTELMTKDMIGLPLLESKCEFRSPLVFDDEACVVTKVTEIHNKVFKLSHTFYKGETLIAEGYTLRAWTSFVDQPKAVKIPDDVREKFQKHLKIVSNAT